MHILRTFSDYLRMKIIRRKGGAHYPVFSDVTWKGEKKLAFVEKNKDPGQAPTVTKTSISLIYSFS